MYVGDLDSTEREVVERHLQAALAEVRGLLARERGSDG